MKLRLTGAQHADLRAHLFPGDGLEAVAFCLCGRRGAEALAVQQVVRIPYEACDRNADWITWRTDALIPVLDEAAEQGLAVVKVHSHPGGYDRFSSQDNRADKELFASVHQWTDGDLPHASVVMLPDGRLFGRSVAHDGGFSDLTLITVVGDDLLYFPSVLGEIPAYAIRHGQAFGEKTTALMGQLSAAVIGCSGTGGPSVEMLARLGFARLVLVDDDKVEEKNLNRIPNTTTADIGRFKVDVAADAVNGMGLGTNAEPLRHTLLTPEAVRAVAGCDVVFGCMDGAEGRHTLNRLATFYCLPYFDVGVRLIADGQGGIEQICGSVHYLQPGGSSLLSRGAITRKQLEAEGMRRTDPEEYKRLRKARYIDGVNEDRPAVIAVNMHYASLAVLEFLARVHPYRDDENALFDRFGSSLTQYRFVNDEHPEPCPALARFVGKGDVVPLLGLPSLSEA